MTEDISLSFHLPGQAVVANNFAAAGPLLQQTSFQKAAVCVPPSCWGQASALQDLLGRSPRKNCKNDLDDQT